MVKKYVLGLFSWRTAYKVIMITLCVFFILAHYFIALFDYKGSAFDFAPANERAGNFLSFFEFQVLVIILVYFINTLAFYRTEGMTRWTNTTSKIAVATYTSFVLIIYWTVLFPWIVVKQPYVLKPWHWVVIAFQNGVIPLLLLIYVIMTSNDEYIYFRQFFLRKLWLISFYPIMYLIFILVRGKLRLLDHARNPDLFNNADGTINWILIYNYPFFSYDQKVSFINFDGVLTFICFIFIFIVLFLLLVALNIKIFNYRYQMAHKKPQRRENEKLSKSH